MAGKRKFVGEIFCRVLPGHPTKNPLGVPKRVAVETETHQTISVCEGQDIQLWLYMASRVKFTHSVHLMTLYWAAMTLFEKDTRPCTSLTEIQ